MQRPLAVFLFSSLMIISPVEAAGALGPDAEKALAQERAFLQENAQKPGVVRLNSGLEYRIVEAGDTTAASPGPTDFVTVHYRGTLMNGNEFDSSYARQQPATFAVNAVIRGWTEALQLMKPGAKWTIYVPSGLAYGANGAGALIPPYSPLIFDIELLSVKNALDEENPIQTEHATEEEG